MAEGATVRTLLLIGGIVMNSIIYVNAGGNFNIWVVYLIFSAIAWLVIGTLRWKLVKSETGEYVSHERFGCNTEGTIATVMAVVFGVMLWQESLCGIIQFVIDHANPDTSRGAATCAAWFIIAMLIILYGLIGYVVMEFAAGASFSRSDERRMTMRPKKKGADLVERWGTDEFKLK